MKIGEDVVVQDVDELYEWLDEHIDEDIHIIEILDILDGMDDPNDVIHLVYGYTPQEAFDNLVDYLDVLYIPPSLRVKCSGWQP
jgi:hypothetical protein